MYRNKRPYLYNLFFFLFIFNSSLSYAQDTDTTEVNRESVKVIPFGEISEETEKINLRLFNYRNVLAPIKRVREIDSLLNDDNNKIINEKDAIISRIKDISKRNLKNLNVEWSGQRSRLKSYQDKLSDRSNIVLEINSELILEIQKWEETKNNFIDTSDNKKVYDNLDKIIKALQDVIGITTNRLERIYVVEKKLTELVLFTDDIIAEIDSKKSDFRQDYFVFDSAPIWKINDSISNVAVRNTALNQKERLDSYFSNNLTQVLDFFKNNAKRARFQLAFILCLLFILLLVRKKWKIKLKGLSNPIDVQAKIVLKHYIAVTVVLGLLISAFFYDELIPVIIELHIILIFIGTIILLPKLTNQKFVLFLISVFVAYTISILSSYINPDTSLSRIVLLIKIVILLATLQFGKRIMESDSDKFERLYRPFSLICPIYVFFLIVAIIADVIGMVSLSTFLFNGVILSIILLLIIHLSVKIIASILVLIFKLRKSYNLNAVSTIVHAAHKRIQPILFWLGIIIWSYFTLKSFDILDFFMAWLNELLHITWKVGEMTISLGGVLSFSGIFIFTLLIVKLVASILQDEWMLSMLPRGIAPALSLMLRIILIIIGFYVGLSAAGLDLSKLGFIFGALGVGIGFGLQNVVLNFIAGLILAFERPINLGDTIVVDNEFGVVTSIGVRSSNIKTYDGYEAIIPNGDLITKKVINWTLSDRDKRTKIFFKTAPNADPKRVILILNKIAINDTTTYKDPAPFTYFMGYDADGSLSFELWYWTTFSDGVNTKHELSLMIFEKLKTEGIDAPIPIRRIVKEI